MSHDSIAVMINAICSVWLLGTIDLHSLVGVSLFLFLEVFLFAATALGLQILTAIIRFLTVRLSRVSINAGHLRVINHGVGIDNSAFSNLFLFLLVGLLSAIFLAIGGQISFRLLRWELSWSRGIRVPRKQLEGLKTATHKELTT